MSVWDLVSNTNNTVSILSGVIAIGSALWGAYSSKKPQQLLIRRAFY